VKLKIFDYIFIILFIGIIIFVSITSYTTEGTATTVEIDTSGGQYIYMLDTDQKITVDGPLGSTVIIIENAEVYVEESPCKDKLCIQTSRLTKAGEWNACMPNKVFIRIPESTETELDSLSF
jgi:hypothetical protein